jgi:NAD(P)-dependent dehydrogenase (short-subunit alcohol dehydrogenase family)
MVEANIKRVLVTGGNAGIGKALCQQLASDFGCHVYMGVRSVERGEAALKEIVAASPACEGKIEVFLCDTSDAASILAAASSMKQTLGSAHLYAVVNNAAVCNMGPGAAKGVTTDALIKTNVYGPKLMVEAFVSMMGDKEGRIVNVGSGLGSSYVSKASEED